MADGTVIADWLTRQAQTVSAPEPYLLPSGTYFGPLTPMYSETYRARPVSASDLWPGRQIEVVEGNCRVKSAFTGARRVVNSQPMNVDLGIWSKLTKVVVGLVVLAVLLLIGMCYLPLIQQNERMRTQILKLDDQLSRRRRNPSQLQSQIDALRNDPKTIERLTREKLGYARPDETVVLFTNNPAR